MGRNGHELNRNGSGEYLESDYYTSYSLWAISPHLITSLVMREKNKIFRYVEPENLSFNKQEQNVYSVSGIASCLSLEAGNRGIGV